MDECFRLLVPCMRAVEDQVQLWKLNEVESESLIESFCPACDRLRVIVKSAGKANGWGALAAFPDLPERLACKQRQSTETLLEGLRQSMFVETPFELLYGS
eukprot:m.95161 g.95161  ORF g.95161 m.95161 type:complete len:101 (+) comp36835_c1_seq21:22-324(+)